MTLDGRQSTDPYGLALSYVWTDGQGITIATGSTASVQLPDGSNVIRLTVSDSYRAPGCESECAPNSASDTVIVTVLSSIPPIANAGGSRAIPDTDKLPGEKVTLTGSATSQSGAAIVSYQWMLENAPLGSGAVLSNVPLPDGENRITLVVTDSIGRAGSDTVVLSVASPPPRAPPVANAGPDRSVTDTDGLPGEAVTLDGRQSSDANGKIVSYVWTNGQGITIATGATPSVRLPDGANAITLTIADDFSMPSCGNECAPNTASDSVVVTVLSSIPPIANAGGSRAISDTDKLPGEKVTLSGSASSQSGAAIVSYQWSLGNIPLGSGALLSNVPLHDGDNRITLVVTDSVGRTGSDTVVLTVAGLPPRTPPVANAGPDRSVADTDGLPGETVVLDGRQSTDANGKIVSYVWMDGQGITIAMGPTPSVRLPDGVNAITLTISDDSTVPGCGSECTPNTASDSVVVTVLSSVAPLTSAGGNRTIPDTDKLPGEKVTLNGSASSQSGASIISYQWNLGNTSLGSGALLSNVLLPDGDNRVTLVVTDSVGRTGSDTVMLSVGSPPRRTILAEIPNLTPNEESTATALDDFCLRLAQRGRQTALTADQTDLLNRCNGIIFDPSVSAQTQALEELGAQDLNAIRTQGLLYANTQFKSVSDRLIALRGGSTGLNVNGLNISIDGKALPVDLIAKGLREVFGGGASADNPANELFGARLGVWLRGNYGRGEKSVSPADRGFDSNLWALTGGADYRITNNVVAGASLGYGRSSVSFSPSGQGGLGVNAWTLAAYGSSNFAGNFYVDGIVNYGNSTYDTARRILYTESGVVIDRTARGSTGGNTFSAGLSGGYDFIFGALTLSPTLGYNYIQTHVDGFREFGAQGLDLGYDDRSFDSSTVNAGVRMVYAWKLPWAVLTPHLSGNYVRELQSSVEVFGVRFANDPFANTSSPSPPIFVRSDVPDQSYFRFALGVAAQFKYDISGYLEYQRLESFSYVDFQGLTVGLRIQHAFH